MPSNALHAMFAVYDRSSSSLDEVEVLIGSNPGCLMEKDDYGITPLFLALPETGDQGETQTPLEVVQALIDACPDAILERNASGFFPIQYTLVDSNSFEHTRALINANPAALKLQDGQGNLPLHVAVQHNVDVETFNLILQGYPEACLVRDALDRIPLQCALCTENEDHVSFEVIDALVRAFPDSLLVDDSVRGPFLFHAICADQGTSITEEFIVVVKASYPEVFLSPDYNGRLPLHHICSCMHVRPGSIAAFAILRACPEAARVADNMGEYPLHFSMKCADAKVVKALVDVYPEAVVSMPRRSGLGPLNMLLRGERRQNHRSLEVVKVLVGARPDSLMVKDSMNYDIPLSAAVRNCAHASIVQWLINARPDTLQVANTRGRIALHIATSRMVSFFSPRSRARQSVESLELIKILYRAWPESVLQRDCDGRLPLSLAAVYASPDELEFLLEACPESARIKDNKGMLPLHHGVCESSVDQVRILVEAWPDGLKEPDFNGDIPLFLTLQRPYCLNRAMTELLIEAWPESTRFTNDDGDLLIHKVSSLDSQNDLNLDFASAKYLIETWPESLLVQNRQGKLPLHLLLEKVATEGESGSRKRKRDDAVNRQLEMVRLFVSKCRESVEVVDEDGNIPLITACKNDAMSLDVIDFLTRASMNLLLSNRRPTLSSTGES